MSHVVDRSLESAAVVFGSLPPGGRDLDLLVRSAAYERSRGALLRIGYHAKGDTFAWFGSCSAHGVDLVRVEDWKLGPGQAEALFAAALPLDGYEKLKRPAPHHVLLIAARRFVRLGLLRDNLRQRVLSSVREDPSAWEQAAGSADSWGAGRSLSLLRDAVQGRKFDRRERVAALTEELRGRGSPRHTAAAHAWKTIIRSHSRGAAVSFSGLDGSGKTTQCEALRASLEALGVDAVYSWTKIARDPVLKRIAGPAKALLRGRRRVQAAIPDPTDPTQPAGMSPEEQRAKQLSRGNPAVHLVWTTVVAIANAATQRKVVKGHLRAGRVVICDRYVLDTAAHLRYRYGDSDYRLQILLNKLISPTPLRSYLLEVAPEEALRRKREQYDLEQLTYLARLYGTGAEALDVRRLDGSAPPEELCAAVARDVWEGLG